MNQNAANQQELEALIEAAVQKAIAPLQQEINLLKQHLGIPQTQSENNVLVENTLNQNLLLNTSIPEERTDFARFIQRGLEAEAMRETEETAETPPTKKGWNPFKR